MQQWQRTLAILGVYVGFCGAVCFAQESIKVAPIDGKDDAGRPLTAPSDPLREARSADGRLTLTITPGRGAAAASEVSEGAGSKNKKREHAGTAQGRLVDRSGRERWSAALVNESAPEQAFVQSTGKFVVTLDEAGRGGAAHALVVYGPRGRKMWEFRLKDLLQVGDFGHVRRNGTAIEWLDGARQWFSEGGDEFLLKLNWGPEITIDLRRGKVLRDGVEFRASGELPAEFTDLLPEFVDGDPYPANSFDPAARQRISQMLTALVYRNIGKEMPAELTQAIQALQAQLFGLTDGAIDPSAMEKQLGTILEMASAAGLKVPDEASLAVATPEGRPAAGNSADVGVQVPQPDPANKVNYMAWLAAQTQTDGPSAFENFLAITERNKTNPAARLPDEVDFDKVLAGEPETLNSPAFLSFLEANRENIGLLRGALERDYRGPLVDPTNDETMFMILLPHLSELRNTTKAMMAEARKLESEGRIDEALDNYVDTFASGAQISQGSTLIENLVGIAMQSLGSQTLLDSMAGPVGEQVDYASLAQRLEDSYQPTRRTSETMQFERASVLDFVQRLYDYDPDTQQYKVSPDAPRLMAEVTDMNGGGGNSLLDFMQQAATMGKLGAVGFEGMLAQVNSHYDELTAATAAPFQQGNQQLRDFENRLEHEKFSDTNPVLGALMPAISRANQLATKADTTRNATLLIANLKAYRQQNGSYPDSLAALGGKSFVTDPFSGQQFAYRRNGDDFQLYSLGSDGVDNGGAHNLKADREAGDMVYWPRPPKN